MNIKDWLAASTQHLKSAAVPTARLDCLVFLQDILEKDKSFIIAHPDFEIPPVELAVLDKQLKRRVKHEPLAYIRGKSEFYGREFEVNSHTLVPRPETEAMISLLTGLWQSEFDDYNIADVGTGSGAIGITVALEHPKASVDLVDIDPGALAIAKKNSSNYELDLTCIKSDLLTNTSVNYDIILANLPYVPDDHIINSAAIHEPKHAIFGGYDGLELYRKLFAQVSARKTKPVFVLTESLPFQHKQLAQIAKSAGCKMKTSEDFIQVFNKE